MPDQPSILRHRDLRLFLGTTCLTAIAHFGQRVAVGWFIYDQTRSVLALGLVGLVQFFPALLFFLPAGHLADHFDRRHIIILSLALTFLVSVLLAVVTWAQLPVGWIYAGLVLSGCAQIFNRPARDALLPTLVPAEDYPRAVAFNSSLFQVASVSTPALAGALLAVFGSALPVFFGNMVLALIALTLAALIHSRHHATAPRRGVKLADLLAGLTYVLNQRAVLAVMTIDLFAVLFGGAVALLPLFAKDILHVGPAGLGLLTAAPAVGAAVTGFIVARVGVRIDGKIFLWAVAGYGAAITVFGVSSKFWLSFVALAASGAFDAISVVIRQSVVQGWTPDHLRGRVAAIHRVFVISASELGALESGLLAALIGAIPAVIAGGVVTLLVVAASPKVFPQLLSLKKPRD